MRFRIGPAPRKPTRDPWVAGIAAGLMIASLLAGQGQPKQKAPRKSHCEKAIKAFLATSPHGGPSRSRKGPNDSGARDRARAYALELARRYPSLKPRDVKGFTKKIRSFHKKGRRLGSGGRNWFDEKNKVGLYYVGGNTTRPKGLLIGLHGGGAGSGDASSSYGAYQSSAAKLGLALVCPEVLVKSEHGWTTDGTEEWVLELVDCALRTWKIDPDHVYFAGHSMGGYGSWTLGAHHADRIAAIAPSAGAPTPILDAGDRTTIIDVQPGIIPSLRNIRIVVFQSTDDPRVPPGPNQHAAKRLAEAKKRWGGYDYEYIEVDDRGHGFPKGGPMVLLQKIASAERSPVPERITWQPAVIWKRQFYWLHWETPMLGTTVVADRDVLTNTIRVTCERDGKPVDPNGLRVLLDDRVLNMESEVILTINGKETFRGVPQRSLEALVLSCAHPDPALWFEAAIPTTSSQ